MKIQDSTGSGYGQKINEENQAHTYSASFPVQHHVNHDHGKAYNLLVSKTPTATGDCFVYIKNTDDDDLVITDMKFLAATDEIVQVKLSDIGTPVGGTDTTPANKNAGSAQVASGTFQTGVNITGLSGGITTDEFQIDGGTGTKYHRWLAGLIVPKNKTATFYAVTGGIALRGSISFYIHKIL